MSMFREQLILRALAALAEVADECSSAPAEKSLSLRFILAYTFVAAGGEPTLKWIWTSFWEHATAAANPREPMSGYIRGTGARSALNGIVREVGYETTPDFYEMLRRHRPARRRSSGEAGAGLHHANDEPTDDDAA